MKKISIFVATLILLVCMAVPAAAADGDLVVDNADLLTSSEESSLMSRLEEIGTEYDLDIVVLTVDSTDGLSAMTYADDYYDENGYSEDGVLFLLNMDTENDGENREWWISTTGLGITIFTDYGIECIGSEVVSYLSAGEYAEAFDVFADLAAEFINEYYESGQAFDTNNTYYESETLPWNERINWFESVMVGVIVGILAGLFSRSRGRAKHKNVRNKADAGDYIVQDSLEVTDASDNFLYKNLAVAPIPRDDDRGGGSSTHTGSSGVSHGGGGGRF